MAKMVASSAVLEALSSRMTGLDVHGGQRNSGPYRGRDDPPAPAPQIHSDGVIATNITRDFCAAAEKLEVGQLIKDDYFTLFESVGAIEIMDPKMDTGFLSEGQSMDDDYDLGRDLLPEEVLGIIDQLLCLEMAWHMGHPLSQTVFTSLYIDRLLNPQLGPWDEIYFGKSADDESPVLCTLRAYCLGLIRTCSHVNNRVKSEHFYEEEDFVTHTYNRELLDHVADSEVLDFMKAAQETLSSSHTGGSKILSALEMRLNFRIAFLTTMSTAHQRGLSLSQRSWDALLEILPGVTASHEISQTVPESFSVKLQRKLASTVPPRPAVNIAFEAAYKYLERLCLDGRAVTDILNYYDSHSLMTFIILFQTRKPQPAVFIRTLLQYFIFGEMKVLGSISIRQLLDDDFSSLVLAEDQLLDPNNDEVEVTRDPRFNMAKRMEFFRGRAAQSYLDVLRTLCQNRCRTRRELTHNIADWENLQLDAEDLDVELREFTNEEPVIDAAISPDPIYSFPLSSWSYFYKLRQMEWIVQMGFELEVYQVDELAGMYWYLQYLTQTRIRHVERIRGFTMKRLAAFSRSRNSSSKKVLGINRMLSYVNYCMLEATAIQGLADALTCLYTVLTRKGLLPSPVRPYGNEQLRYELRMKPFLPIGLPEFIPYEQFHLSVTQPSESTNDMVVFASEAVARAKKDFELMSRLDGKTARFLGSEEAWTKNVKDSLKACISASISISIVKKALEKAERTGEKLEVSVDVLPVGKGYHHWWIVPTIVPDR